MSAGTLYLLAGIGGFIALVLLAGLVEMIVRRPKKRTFAEKFDIDPASLREVHTSFGNPLGQGDMQRASDYMREQSQGRRASGKHSTEKKR